MAESTYAQNYSEEQRQEFLSQNPWVAANFVVSEPYNVDLTPIYAALTPVRCGSSYELKHAIEFAHQFGKTELKCVMPSQFKDLRNKIRTMVECIKYRSGHSTLDRYTLRTDGIFLGLSIDLGFSFKTKLGVMGDLPVTSRFTYDAQTGIDVEFRLGDRVISSYRDLPQP